MNGASPHQNVTNFQQYSLSSPLRGTNYLDFNVEADFYKKNGSKILNIMDKISNCGIDTVEFVHLEKGEFIEFVSYCDNRSCMSDGCQKHRGSQYMRANGGKIRNLNNSMLKPKAWVFTTKRLHMPIDREYCMERTLDLYHLLSNYASSDFSIHMEIKFLKRDKSFDGTYYLHFHVVCGGLKDYRLVRKLWGFNVYYETAIRPVQLGFYVSKYASKTPVFPDEFTYHNYMIVVYKLRMHRFSCKDDGLKTKSKYIPVFILMMDRIDERRQSRDHCDLFGKDRPPDWILKKRCEFYGIDYASSGCGKCFIPNPITNEYKFYNEWINHKQKRLDDYN